MKKGDRDKYFTKTDLKLRGWSETIIEKLLPMPHETAKNPRFRSAAPMKLYLKSKVQELEKTKEFLEVKERLDKRRGPNKVTHSQKMYNLTWYNNGKQFENHYSFIYSSKISLDNEITRRKTYFEEEVGGKFTVKIKEVPKDQWKNH